jgi:hypothetical protein
MRRRNRRVEENIQARFFDHIRTRGVPGLVCWHTPQGNKLGGFRVNGIPLQAILNKRLGVLAGVSDILAFHSGQMFCFELKSESGKVSPAQDAFLAAMRAQGATCAVARGLDQALSIFEGWHLLRGKMARLERRGTALCITSK